MTNLSGITMTIDERDLFVRVLFDKIGDLKAQYEFLSAENEQLRAQLAAVPVDRIATLAELSLRSDDESVQLAGKIIAGWLYEWKVQP